MNFKALELAIRQYVESQRVLENEDADVSVTELIYCGKKAELSKVYEEEGFNPDIYTGYIVELFIKSAIVHAYGEERVQLEKSYVEDFMGMRIVGHVDAVIDFGDKVVGIDVKAPKRVYAVGSIQKGGILVDHNGLILNNPAYLLQAGLYKRFMEKEHRDKKVEFYLLYNTLVNGKDRVFMAVPVENSVSDQTLERLINRFKEKKPAFRNECESYCRFKELNLCTGAEVTQEIPYTELEKTLGAYVEALKAYESAKENLNILTKLLQQLVPDGTVQVNGMEFGWKKVVGYTLNKEALLNFIKNASEEELRLVLDMLTHKPAYGERLNEISLTDAVENVKFIPPNPFEKKSQRRRS